MSKIDKKPAIGDSVSVFINGERSPGLVQAVHEPDPGKKDYNEVTAVIFPRGDATDSLSLKYSTDDFEYTWCYPGEAGHE